MFLKISVHLLIIMLEQQFSVPFFFSEKYHFHTLSLAPYPTHHPPSLLAQMSTFH